MTRPEAVQLDAAHELLERLAAVHGRSHLRHGDEFGEVVANVADGRSYFDVVAFEGRLGWRPSVVSSAAPAARPVRPLGAASDLT